MRDVDGVPRREHQDRHVRARSGAARRQTSNPSMPGSMTSRMIGVVLGDRGLVERVLAVARDIDGIRLLAQALRQHLRGARLVLDQQHPHRVVSSSIVAREVAAAVTSSETAQNARPFMNEE